MKGFVELSHEKQETVLLEVAKKAAAQFGLAEHCEPTLINYRENAVYKVSDPKTKATFALRVHRFGYQTEASIQSELEMGRILNRNDISSPVSVAAPDGSEVIKVNHAELDGPRYCSLLNWMSGEMLAEGEDVATLVETWGKLGEINARVHKAFDNADLPAWFERQIWDEDGLAGKSCIWGDYHDCKGLTGEQVSILENAEGKVRRTLAMASRDKPEFGLIHADLMPSNVMVDGDELRVIDFDDSGFGWRVYELATSLFVQELEEYRPQLIEAWVQGYRKVLELSDESLALLPSLIMARRLKIFGWMSTRAEAPIVQELGPLLIETGVEIALKYLDNDL